ncbi:MAG: UDP-glucose 4-epimerase GalE [Gudongella sp.]|nr:UDP-glucose 4-epimerase GalE [Gudongella sp.]
MRVLVTGGLGFIGSHTALMLLQKGYEVIILDNLSNSNPAVLGRINSQTGNKALFVKGDILDVALLKEVFREHEIHGVIHFAALKSVKESIEKPERYHLNNVVGTERLIRICAEQGIGRFIFSSSAAVYGSAASPVTENSGIGEIPNPYGRSKASCEDLLKTTHFQYKKPDITILRYFNVAGAHPDGILWEEAQPDGGNLMSHIIRVASEKTGKLYIYGGDYDTPDGTGIRDYIHVMDVARGHVLALEKQKEGVHTYNLGSGRGTSVLELIQTFQEVNGVDIRYEITGRRIGDISVSYADSTRALDELGWRAELDICDIVRDSWSHSEGGVDMSK